MDGENKSIKFNAFMNGFRTILNLIFPLITFPYISRVLTVDEIGKYNFSESIVSYFLMIAALGINSYAIREGTRYRDSKSDISHFASKIFSVNIISTILSYIGLFILLLFSDKLNNYLLCIVILSTQIVFTTLGTEWIYSIYEEYTYITLRSIIFKILSIVCLFVFVRHQGDYIKYAVITVMASVGSNVLNFIHAKKLCSIRFTLSFNWKEVLKPVLVIFASNIAIQIYVNSDITMLGYLGNDRSVGIYSISTKVYTMIKNVITAVLTVTIPRFSLYSTEKDRKNYDRLLQKVINTLIVIVFPMMIGLIILSKHIVLIVAGDNYLESVPSLCILSIAILFSIFNGLFSQCVLLPFKRENVFLKCTIVSAIANICLNFVLIPLWGEVAAAVTTLISELILCIMLYIRSKDIVKETFSSGKTVKNLISVIIAVTGMGIMCLFIVENLADFHLQIFCAVIVSVLTYGLILIILKNDVLAHLDCHKSKH